MSELKDYDIMDIEAMDDARLEKSESGKIQVSRVYLKSEADKVIAHQKYKRCLAMADMNWWQANRYSAAEMVERIRGNFEDARQCSEIEQKYYKRYKIWLELADKFKEVSK